MPVNMTATQIPPHGQHVIVIDGAIFSSSSHYPQQCAHCTYIEYRVDFYLDTLILAYTGFL